MTKRLRQFAERGEVMCAAASLPTVHASSPQETLSQAGPGSQLAHGPEGADSRTELRTAGDARGMHRGAHLDARGVRAAHVFSTHRQAGPALARVPGGSQQHRQEIRAMTSHHVIITRTADSSAQHALGHPSQAGKVTTSRTFHDRSEAQREADAWSHAGEFARYGVSDWSAEVRPGPAPAAACGVKVCTVLTQHRH